MAVAASADLRTLSKDLSRASGNGIEEEAAVLISQTAQQIQSLAKSKAPVKTGKLQQSIHVRWDHPLSVTIAPDVPYAVYQEFGTGTRGEFPGAMYEIKPKKPDGVLVFEVNGKTVFAKIVKHPGIKARPYMRPAFEEALGDFTKKLADEGLAQVTRGPNG